LVYYAFSAMLFDSCMTCMCMMSCCRWKSWHEGRTLCSTRQGYHTSLCREWASFL